MTSSRVARPVLVAGSLNMDLVARCEHLPREGQTVFGRDFFTAPGGKGANQAVAAARLGARVAMAGCVGRDRFGTALVDGLAADAIDTRFVGTSDQPTGTALVTIDAAGANTIVVIPGANQACGAAAIDAAFQALSGPGVLLLQHEIPDDANRHALTAARTAGWFTVLNPAPARAVPPDLLPLVDILAPNETEAATLTGCPAGGRDAALRAARALLAAGARAVLVTLGAEGALYLDPSRALHCPSVVVPAVDSTGAGDAFLGALGAALAEDQALEAALGFAAAAAALAVTRLGAQPAMGTRDELAAFIAQHGMPVAKPWAEAAGKALNNIA
jgi:ribokinase